MKGGKNYGNGQLLEEMKKELCPIRDGGVGSKGLLSFYFVWRLFDAGKERKKMNFFGYPSFLSAVGDAIANAINSVVADIKIITSAIFALLLFVAGIVFVVALVVELIEYKKNQKELDWKRLLFLLIAILICAGGAPLAFTLGGVG